MAAQDATAASLPLRDHPELGPDPLGARIRGAFRSSRLTYRGVEMDDAELMFRVRSDPEVEMNASAGYPKPYTMEDAKKFIPMLQSNIISAVIELDSEKEQPRLAEELRDPSSTSIKKGPTSKSGKIAIGEVSLRSALSNNIHTVELAINILPAYHGAGYGTEAIRWILDWAFELAGLHRVRLSCFSFNTKAIRVYEAIGFERCGVEKESIWLGGRYWDFVTYGMLDRDWVRIKEERRAKGLRT